MLHQSLAHRRDLIERFEVEARALGHLSHPGIIEIFQLNRTRDDKQMPYYLMEVLTGESLADSLRRHGNLDLFTALGIATKLLHALDHAHERGIVHRDIKPDNIFLHRGSSSEPVVKLLDFGILKLVASEENPGIFIGTPRYCAPEQLQAGPSIGPKADLYSVGVVLFQMLTSHLPFEGYGGSLEEMVHTLIVQAPPLSKHGKFPPALVALVASALAKEPGKRPADAFTFASELRKIRRDFAPDREDPHTHVTAEVIAEPGRPQRDASQITSAHLAAPTSPDEDMGKLMDALRAGEGAGVEDVLRDMENQPSVSITGFESTAEEPVAIPPSPPPGKPEVQRDAVTALPRSGSSERTPGSIRYVTKEAPHAEVAAVVDSPRPKAVIQRTVPMARPKPVHHYTEPMAGRPGRFAHPVANDARTPEPQAIDNLSASRRAPSQTRVLARMKRQVERVVPLARTAGGARAGHRRSARRDVAPADKGRGSQRPRDHAGRVSRTDGDERGTCCVEHSVGPRCNEHDRRIGGHARRWRGCSDCGDRECVFDADSDGEATCAREPPACRCCDREPAPGAREEDVNEAVGHRLRVKP